MTDERLTHLAKFDVITISETTLTFSNHLPVGINPAGQNTFQKGEASGWTV